MSSRGAPRGRGGSSSTGRGGGFGSSGRGGFQPSYGPPAAVLEMGSFLHASEGDIVCESINPKVPKFNAPIYLENKTAIGKVDEILGPINQVYFTVKPQEGIVATSFKSGDKFYIGGDRLLPLEMYGTSRWLCVESAKSHKAPQNQSALAVDQGVHPCAVEEVLEAAVEEHLEVVEDLVIGQEEEVEVVGSVLVEGEGEEVVEEEVVTRISQDQQHSEGAVHSGVMRSFGATCSTSQTA
ncbi:H/ACA snoRNP pseudouridylase subunit [Pseudocyphellaria aurata]|nr:H/ACA snoRNP pseudouridylase subunit [Pseudocyphellaria aurata]